MEHRSRRLSRAAVYPVDGVGRHTQKEQKQAGEVAQATGAGSRCFLDIATRGHHAPSMRLSPDDIAELTRLEEAMWTAATRFDATFQQERLGADFFEFGQSGRVYAREQAILTGRGEIKARIPLDGLQIRPIDESTAQVTYNSH